MGIQKRERQKAETKGEKLTVEDYTRLHIAQK